MEFIEIKEVEDRLWNEARLAWLLQEIKFDMAKVFIQLCARCKTWNPRRSSSTLPSWFLTTNCNKAMKIPSFTIRMTTTLVKAFNSVISCNYFRQFPAYESWVMNDAWRSVMERIIPTSFARYQSFFFTIGWKMCSPLIMNPWAFFVTLITDENRFLFFRPNHITLLSEVIK